MAETLQSLLDDFMLAAASVFAPAPEGPEPADSALAMADSISNLEEARRRLVGLLDQLPRQHVANFRKLDWVLEHPLSCRRADRPLSACPLNAKPLNVEAAPPVGRYEVSLADGVLVVGAPVFDRGHSPELTATLGRTGPDEEVQDDGDEAQAGGEAEGDRGQHRGGGAAE